MMDFITTYVIGPAPGGLMVSYGALFVAALWFAVSKIKKVVKSRG